MKSLSSKELLEVNGGSEATRQAGHDAGKAIHDAVVNAWDTVVSWFN